MQLCDTSRPHHTMFPGISTHSTFRVVLDGPSGVGKSWILSTFLGTSPTGPTQGSVVQPIAYGSAVYSIVDISGDPTRRTR